MFFVLSKILAFATRPSNVLFMLAALGIVLMATRYAKAGRRLLVGIVLLMIVLGLSPLGAWSVRVLENRFPQWDPSQGAPDGIVVLGGAVGPDISAARNEISVGAAAERLTVIPELARRYPNARIVYTGGSSSILDGPREADYVGPLMESFGLAPGRVLLERDSRNTEENATFTKAMVKPKPGERWLLVTSSWHMPRAVGVFRKAGFDVEPYPVDWISTGEPMQVGLSSTVARGLAALDDASHEWVGMLAYWLTGRSSELFPGPQPNRDAAGRSGTRP